MHKVKDIRLIKNNLREKYKSMRLSLPPEKKAFMDEAVARRLMGTWQFQKAQTVFTYVSTPIEVNTFRVIRASLAAGKRVAVPACVKGTRQMDFYYITSLENLAPGTFGVLEPDPLACEKCTKFEEGICIVPGLSFDTRGYRLGYGKGYYDRWLAGFTGVTAGICYSCCIRPVLPHGRFDRAVDLLVTEKRLKNCKKGGGTR